MRILGSSYRNQYLERKVYRITDRTIWALTEQLKKVILSQPGLRSVFTDGSPESDADSAFKRGRRSICAGGLTESIFAGGWRPASRLKIIDYKTGKKTKFDLTDIYYGLQLQLVCLMDAAMEKIGREYRIKRWFQRGFSIIISRIRWWSASRWSRRRRRMPIILKALRMNGLVNGDREALAHPDNRLGEEATVDSDVVPVSIKNEAIVERRSQAAGEEKIPCAGRVCEPENEAYGAGDSGWKYCGVAVQKRPENGVRLLPVPQCVRI